MSAMGLPSLVQYGWEEFVWDGEPFGFHLRGQQGARNRAAELAALDDVLTSFMDSQRYATGAPVSPAVA